MHIRLVATAIVALAIGGAGACAAATPGTPNITTTAGVDAAGAWRVFIACARSNGYPNWPDPAVDPNTGAATFPQTAGFLPKEAFDAVRDACGTHLDRLPPQANPLSRPTVSPSLYQAKLRYSQCMREHGVPEWQDPGPDGYYHNGGIPGYNTDPAVTARVNAARDGCDPILGG